MPADHPLLVVVAAAVVVEWATNISAHSAVVGSSVVVVDSASSNACLLVRCGPLTSPGVKLLFPSGPEAPSFVLLRGHVLLLWMSSEQQKHVGETYVIRERSRNKQ